MEDASLDKSNSFYGSNLVLGVLISHRFGEGLCQNLNDYMDYCERVWRNDYHEWAFDWFGSCSSEGLLISLSGSWHWKV
jgi:hypothetical protein